MKVEGKALSISPRPGGGVLPRKAKKQAAKSSSLTASSSTGKKPALSLERVLGLTALHNSALATNSSRSSQLAPIVAYVAGSSVVLYNSRKNKQVRILRSTSRNACSCVAFSSDGTLVAVGERGHQPAVQIFEVRTGKVLVTLKGHKFGISCLAFCAGDSLLVTVGFRHDHTLAVWAVGSGKKLYTARLQKKVFAVQANPEADEDEKKAALVTVGEQSVTFWSLSVLSREQVALKKTKKKKDEDTDDDDDDDDDDDVDGSELDSASVAQVPTKVRVSRLPGITATHSGETFVDAAWGLGDSAGNVYAVTASGVLCIFSKSRLMEQVRLSSSSSPSSSPLP